MNDQPPLSQFEDRDAVVPSDHYAAAVVAGILGRILPTDSVLELGCGSGLWLRALADSTGCKIFGVEDAAFAPRTLAIDPRDVLNTSAVRPLLLHRAFDLVLCLDPAEHATSAETATILVENCVRHGDIVLFGTAPVEQPNGAPVDWLARFREHGFLAADLIRPLIWYDPRIAQQYRQNLLVFYRERSCHAAELEAEAARTAQIMPPPQRPFDWMQSLPTSSPIGDVALGRSGRQPPHQAAQIEYAVAGHYAAQERARVLAAELAELQAQIANLAQEHAAALGQANSLSEHVDALQRELAATQCELERTQSTVAVLRQERAIILGSTLWRMAEPLRAFGRKLPMPVRLRIRQTLHATHRLAQALAKLRSALRRPRRQHADAASATSLAAPDPLPARDGACRIVIISGEAHTPGHHYRVLRMAEAAAAIGATVTCVRVEDWETQRDAIIGAHIVWIWRAPYAAATSAIMQIARRAEAKVVFDLDDLMLKPELARIDIIDGIRSQGFSADGTAQLFARIQKLALMADICTCTTSELAEHIREYQKIAAVLPNGFDAATLAASRLAVRARRQATQDGLIRIGYASGSRTHQRDFAQAVEAVARILQEHPECRLVLFRDRHSHEPVVHASEFSVLDPFAAQIEWRDMVSLPQLPAELARFDINLIPLEVGNPFCEAKSELKYFEAALVEVCSVASRTGPMGRAIRDRETGRLVDTAEGWYEALHTLVSDAALRQRLAHAAYLDVLWRFGPQRREQTVSALIKQVLGGSDAAQAFRDEVRRVTAAAPQFDIPPSRVVFASDAGGLADVTVIVPLYNYAHYVEEALESVRRQTLDPLDLIIVDDASTDTSLAVAETWARTHVCRFNRLLVLRNERNVGLARSRNVGFDAAETPFVLPLDADNRLLPTCCAQMLGTLRNNRAAFAYPKIQCFGEANHIIGDEAFSPLRLAGGNYIDAMALIGKWAWAAVGGYHHIQFGWEDFDFWCRCVEQEFWGVQVPEVLAEYRVHQQSMLKTSTDRHENKLKLIRDLNTRHAWLSIPYRA